LPLPFCNISLPEGEAAERRGEDSTELKRTTRKVRRSSRRPRRPVETLDCLIREDKNIFNLQLLNYLYSLKFKIYLL